LRRLLVLLGILVLLSAVHPAGHGGGGAGDDRRAPHGPQNRTSSHHWHGRAPLSTLTMSSSRTPAASAAEGLLQLRQGGIDERARDPGRLDEDAARVADRLGQRTGPD